MDSRGIRDVDWICRNAMYMYIYRLLIAFIVWENICKYWNKCVYIHTIFICIQYSDIQPLVSKTLGQICICWYFFDVCLRGTQSFCGSRRNVDCSSSDKCLFAGSWSTSPPNATTAKKQVLTKGETCLKSHCPLTKTVVKPWFLEKKIGYIWRFA